MSSETENRMTNVPQGTCCGGSNSDIPAESITEAVRKHYSKVARGGESCGCNTPETEATLQADAQSLAREMGYNDEELGNLPEGANLGLGCGNPTAMAGLSEGEVVLDLGSGAGFDAFIAARKVGSTGHVYGVDVNDDMLAKARENSLKSGFSNVEFVKGSITDIPLKDGIADVIISNCVINLVPDKQAVYSEAFRLLKPGGRLEVSDVVALTELSEEIRRDMRLVSCCIGGAATVERNREMLEKAGFTDVSINVKEESKELIDKWGLEEAVRQNVRSALISARK